MKTTKLLALLTALFCVTTLSAQTNVSTDSELRAAVQINNVDIKLLADINLSNSTLEITGNRTVTIDLAGHTLNRGLTKREWNTGGQVITVRKGATLNLSNGTLKGGWGGNGGGLVNEGGNVTLTNVNITGNTADDRGGGISNHGTLTMTGGSISGNTSKDGTDPKGGGGLFNYKDATATLKQVWFCLRLSLFLCIYDANNGQRVLMILAGLPPTTALSGTSLVTTAPAATTALRPMVTPGQMMAPMHIHAFSLMVT